VGKGASEKRPGLSRCYTSLSAVDADQIEQDRPAGSVVALRSSYRGGETELDRARKEEDRRSSWGGGGVEGL
jgi:hypothetical protein